MAVVLNVTSYCLPGAYLPNCTAIGPQLQKFRYQFEVCERLQLQAGEGGISIELCGKERAVRVCIGLNWFHIRNRIKTFS